MSRKRIIEITLSFIVALLIYGAFYFIYKNSIAPLHAYHGFKFRELTFGVHLIAACFFLLPLLWLPITPKKPSDLALWFLYMFSYAPTTFMCFHVMKKPFPDAIFLMLTLLLALIIMDISRRHRVKLSLKSSVPIFMPWDLIIIVVSMLVCAYIVYLSKFNFNFDFFNVYERRLEVRGSSAFLSSYILAFGKSLIMILSAYLAFVKKSKMAFIVLLILAISIFAYDGTKSSVLIPVFLGMIYILMKYKKNHIMFNTVLLIIIVLSIVEFVSLQTNITGTFLTRRIFAVPGLLNSFFWEYFSVHDKIMLTDSIGRYFTDSSHVVGSTYMIGYEYFNKIETNANTGIWMGSYAHFGFAGIVLVQIIAGFILGLVDNLTKSRFLMLGYIVCAYIGILWSEQMFQTSMLTGGVFYILLFLLLYCNSSILDRNITFFTKRNFSSNNSTYGSAE